MAGKACVPYASSAGYDKVARRSARGQRYVAVLLTSYAASASINADQARSSQLGAHCLINRTLYRRFTIKCASAVCVLLVLCPRADIGESMYGPGVTSGRAKGSRDYIGASQGVTHPRFRIASVKPQPVFFRQPGVAGSSPCTLTTSLATPGPSSSCSNGPSN